MFFSSMRNDPEKHINIFLPPTQSWDSPPNMFVFTCFFLSLSFSGGNSRVVPCLLCSSFDSFELLNPKEGPPVTKAQFLLPARQQSSSVNFS